MCLQAYGLDHPILIVLAVRETRSSGYQEHSDWCAGYSSLVTSG